MQILLHLKKLYTKHWGQAGDMPEAGCVNWGLKPRAQARVKLAQLFANQQTEQVSSPTWVWFGASAAATKTQRQVARWAHRFEMDDYSVVWCVCDERCRPKMQNWREAGSGQCRGARGFVEFVAPAASLSPRSLGCFLLAINPCLCSGLGFTAQPFP